MAVLKANYVKRGRGDRQRAKASIRYIMHRRDRDGARITRSLFSFEGSLTKAHAYRMIDEAPGKGTYFYRIVISPDPKREDTLKDLNLTDITIDTMLALEARLGKPIQFLAALHDDHSPHRHVHTLVILNGRRLTRADFAVLRAEATGRARSQRRFRDRLRGYDLTHSRSLRLLHHLRQGTPPHFSGGSRPLQGYTCPLCGYHQALPFTRQGYRCPMDGLYLRRDRPDALLRPRRLRGVWLARAL